MEADRLRAAEAAWVVELFEFREDFGGALLFCVQGFVYGREGGGGWFSFCSAGFLKLCVSKIRKTRKQFSTPAHTDHF